MSKVSPCDKQPGEDQVACIAGNGSFVLSPEEGPVVEVLEVVGPVKEKAWSHIAGNEVPWRIRYTSLSIQKEKRPEKSDLFFVGAEGVEPPTLCL